MLRAAFDRFRADVDSCKYTERTLHGEPHSGNLLSTPQSRPEYPEMRWHAEHHLEKVRQAVR